MTDYAKQTNFNSSLNIQLIDYTLGIRVGVVCTKYIYLSDNYTFELLDWEKKEDGIPSWNDFYFAVI